MRKSNAFRPTSLDSLESRIALSGAGLGSLAGSAHVSGATTEKGHHGGADPGTHAHHTPTHHHAEHRHHEHKPVK